MPQPVEPIDKIAHRLTVARSHLFMLTEEVFQPDMQGSSTLVGGDDIYDVAELVIEFHYYVPA